MDSFRVDDVAGTGFFLCWRYMQWCGPGSFKIAVQMHTADDYKEASRFWQGQSISAAHLVVMVRISWSPCLGGQCSHQPLRIVHPANAMPD